MFIAKLKWNEIKQFNKYSIKYKLEKLDWAVGKNIFLTCELTRTGNSNWIKNFLNSIALLLRSQVMFQYSKCFYFTLIERILDSLFFLRDEISNVSQTAEGHYDSARNTRE